MTITRRRGVLLGATALAVALAATACGSSSSSAGCGKTSSGSAQSATVSDADLQAALTAGGNLTVWAWEPTLKKVVADFQTKYPNVHVNLVNAGTGNDEYKALQNAVKAGKGVPDVAQIEYYALPQFALTKSLANLDQYGFGLAERHVHAPVRGTPSRSTAASTACRWTPARWRCSTTRRSSTSTASPCRRRGTSTSPTRRSCTPPTRPPTSPTTPVTPASPPA